MALFEIVTLLLLVGAMLALLADRIGVPYPALLALAGAGVALIPGAPSVTLDPELALALFVAPVLLDAAFDASPRDLHDNIVPVSLLAVVVVVLTIAAVAFAARLVVPEMSWFVAITLGAIVAPPDASAATAVLRKLRPPHRIVVILEGESLFNDATALIIYRVAVGAVITGAFSGWTVLPTLLLAAGGGVIVGIALSRFYLWTLHRVKDIQVSIVLQFIGTFAVWVIAERLGLSAIITVVAFAMTAGRHAPGRIGARDRISSYAVWEVAVFVLNVLAFVLIGLQLRGILQRVASSELNTYLLCAGAVCLAVILIRFIWMPYNWFVRWHIRRYGANLPRPMSLPTVGSGLLISWCGMRGIVTLAAALALPDGGPVSAFPHRDLIVFCAFCVVLSTLVVQGATLRPLLKWLGLRDDGTVERELQTARLETARAALTELEGKTPDAAAEILRREYRARILACDARSAPSAEPEGLADLQQLAALTQRRALVDLRSRSVIGDDAFHAAEEEIDLLELTASTRVHPASESDALGTRETRG
ncbi:MAG: Na+/H+ antiporter [Gammaproteobacteria bacterium]